MILDTMFKLIGIVILMAMLHACETVQQARAESPPEAFIQNIYPKRLSDDPMHRDEAIFTPRDVLVGCGMDDQYVLCKLARWAEQKRAEKYHDEPCWLRNKC